MSPWEVAAVVLALTFLVLAIREHVACWPAAIVSAAIYFVLMFRAGLYMISGLQIFYVAMAFYGWHSWKHGGAGGRELAISSWPLRRHVAPLASILFATLVSGYLLGLYTDAAMPYLDSLVSWGAIFSTWLVARKVIQNWHYWFAIDSISVYLYFTRGLYLTAILFVLYLVLVVVGLRQWRRRLHAADT